MRAASIATTFIAFVASAAFAAPMPQKRGDFHNRAARLTWYSGNSLHDPYCGGDTPKDSDMVVATSFDSPYQCGDSLTFEYFGKSATVKVVDRCEGCSADWFDLTKGAFSALTDLEVGVLEDVDYWSP